MFKGFPGGGKKKQPTKEDMQKLREGGKKADKLKAQKEEHHATVDAPAAEELLEAEMKKLEGSEENTEK